MEPTQKMVDAMRDSGMTNAQIADHFGCSKAYIAKMRKKVNRGVETKDLTQDAITAEELERARRIKIGDAVTIVNRFRMKPGDEMSWGVVEQHKVMEKFPYVVLLDNGMSVDYAEVAMQMRRNEG